ncbi:hypothetical protein QR680_008486 [Steinernema hermaphroditum]|uniref:Uncharacterized protein n=1 Tax=Steinernema hermaphroditum TaxID=289476 RepID=A0AA39IGS4_9BILA|nr:hypothetical protein QR680_008486 [Steinernema hermaphroditum]
MMMSEGISALPDFIGFCWKHKLLAFSLLPSRSSPQVSSISTRGSPWWSAIPSTQVKWSTRGRQREDEGFLSSTPTTGRTE